MTRVRWWAGVAVAAWAVACARPPEVDHAALRRKLLDGRESARLAAITALAPVAEREDVAAMARAAKSGSEAVRIGTAQALGRAQEEATVDALGSLLTDPLDSVRATAATALALKPGTKADAYVVSAFDGGGPLTRAALASRPDLLSRALRREAGRAAKKRGEALRSGDLQMRAWALEETGRAGGPMAKTTLVSELTATENLFAAAAARGLALVADPESMPAIGEVVRSGSPARAHVAAEALATFDAGAAFDTLAARADVVRFSSALMELASRVTASDDRRTAACRLAQGTDDVASARALLAAAGGSCRLDATMPSNDSLAAARWFLLAERRVTSSALKPFARRALLGDDVRLAAGAATWLGVTGAAADGPLLAARAMALLSSAPFPPEALAPRDPDEHGDVFPSLLADEFKPRVPDKLERLLSSLPSRRSAVGPGHDTMSIVAAAAAGAARLGADVTALVEALAEAESPGARRLAAAVASLAAKDGASLLARLLTSPSPIVRWSALLEQATKGDAAAWRHLLAEGAGIPDALETEAVALLSTRPADSAALRRALAAANGPGAVAALRSLESDPDEASRTILEERAASIAPDVASAAVSAMASRPDARWPFPALLHPDVAVRTHAWRLAADKAPCPIAPVAAAMNEDRVGAVREASQRLVARCACAAP